MIPPLLNAYHVTRSVSRDKHKLEVMMSDDSSFLLIPSRQHTCRVSRPSRIKWRVNRGKYTLLFRRRNAAGTTHELSPTRTKTKKIFKAGYKMLNNASFKSWRGHDM